MDWPLLSFPQAPGPENSLKTASGGEGRGDRGSDRTDYRQTGILVGRENERLKEIKTSDLLV